MALEGSERKALHAILHEQGGSQAGYVDDSKIAEIAYLSIEEVRDCLETLEAKECVERSSGWVVTAPISRRRADRNSDGRRSSSVTREPRAHSRSCRRAFGHSMPRTKTSSSNCFPVLAVATGSPNPSTSGSFGSKRWTRTRPSGWATSSARAAAASRPSSKRVCSLVCPSPSSPSTSRRRARTLKPDCSEDCGSSTPTCPPTSISAPLWSLRGRESGRDQTRSCS